MWLRMVMLGGFLSLHKEVFGALTWHNYLCRCGTEFLPAYEVQRFPLPLYLLWGRIDKRVGEEFFPVWMGREIQMMDSPWLLESPECLILPDSRDLQSQDFAPQKNWITISRKSRSGQDFFPDALYEISGIRRLVTFGVRGCFNSGNNVLQRALFSGKGNW